MRHVITLTLINLAVLGCAMRPPLAPTGLTPLSALQAQSAPSASVAAAIKAAYASRHMMPTHVGSRTTTTTLDTVTVQPTGTPAVVAFDGILAVSWVATSFAGPTQHGASSYHVTGTYDTAANELHEASRTPLSTNQSL